MNFHRNTCEAVVNNLFAIFDENRYADKVIEKTLKSNPRWGARDRRFIAESTYEIVRWWRFLCVAGKIKETGYPLYWQALGLWLGWKGYFLPDWPEWNEIELIGINEPGADTKYPFPIEASVPDWLDCLGRDQLGDLWEKECRAMNQQAEVVLRINTLKTDAKTLGKLLLENDVKTHILPGYPDALVLDKRQNVFQSPAFKDGLFEVQDASSQRVAAFMEVTPGMRVIDACAGGGGKSLHLAALMENKGRLISMDVEDWKLEELKKRARRAGVHNLETRIIEGLKSIKKLHDSADRLLLDVPCSGLGVLRRNPDAKWKLSESFIGEVQKTQREILENYWPMVKKGGMMVYATCSILPVENHLQVTGFLVRRDGVFELVKEKQEWPSEGFDGFYMAMMRRVS